MPRWRCWLRPPRSFPAWAPRPRCSPPPGYRARPRRHRSRAPRTRLARQSRKASLRASPWCTADWSRVRSAPVGEWPRWTLFSSEEACPELPSARSRRYTAWAGAFPSHTRALRCSISPNRAPLRFTAVSSTTRMRLLQLAELGRLANVVVVG